jgi:hypothetical protein
MHARWHFLESQALHLLAFFITPIYLVVIKKCKWINMYVTFKPYLTSPLLKICTTRNTHIHQVKSVSKLSHPLLYYFIWFCFLLRCWRLNLRPHTCKTSTLSTSSALPRVLLTLSPCLTPLFDPFWKSDSFCFPFTTEECLSKTYSPLVCKALTLYEIITILLTSPLWSLLSFSPLRW